MRSALKCCRIRTIVSKKVDPVTINDVLYETLADIALLSYLIVHAGWTLVG